MSSFPGVAVEEGVKLAHTVITYTFPAAGKLHAEGAMTEEEYARVEALKNESVQFLREHEREAFAFAATLTPTVFHLRVSGHGPRAVEVQAGVSSAPGRARKWTRTLCGASVGEFDMTRGDFRVSLKTDFRPKPHVSPCPLCAQLFREGK